MSRESGEVIARNPANTLVLEHHGQETHGVSLFAAYVFIGIANAFEG